MKEMKRILSLVLCMVMLIGVIPVNAFASEDAIVTDEIAPVAEVAAGAEAPVVIDEITELQTDTALAGDTVLDAAIFCSDVHKSTSDLTSVLGGVKTSGVDYSSIGFVGDTCLTVANTTSTVQSALSDTDIAVMFSYAASHDTENSADISTNWDYSGEVKGVSDYYLVYTIRETDMQTASGAESAAPAFTEWYNDLTAAQKALPIFIMSHRPLHDRRDDNDGAATWYSSISAAAESSDITVFWAHNHTNENDVDRAAYYVAKDGDETFTVYNGSTVTPNFTYMNAGYINANGQNPARKGVATTVQITADSMIFQDYNSSGAYSGTYAHNVTVAREFAKTKTLTYISVTGTTEYTVGGNGLDLKVTAAYDDGTTADVTADATFEPAELTASGTYTVTASYGGMTATIDVTVDLYDEVLAADGETLLIGVGAFSQGATALEVAWDDAAAEVLDAKGLYTDYVVYDLALTNPGETTEYTMSLVDNMDTTNLAVYHVADDGTLTLVDHKIEDDCVVFTTSLTGTFAYGSITVPEGYTLSSVTLENIPTDLFVGGTLNLENAVITATYTMEGAEDYVRQLTVYDYDETNFSGYDVNVAGAHKAVFTYEGVSATLDIHVWEEEFTVNNVTVHVGEGEYGVTEAVVSESTNANVATAIQGVISGDNYVAYDITLTYDSDYAANDADKTVTLPIPEGVTNPVVYYVSDSGKSVVDMKAEITEDGEHVTFTTTHFSTYVLGDGTVIETESENATTESTTTTTTKTVYVLTSSISSDNQYLIVNGNSAGSYYALANSSGSVAATDVTIQSGDVDGDGDTETYIELDDAIDELWTTSDSSSTTLKNGSYYLTYSGSRGNYSLTLGSESTWTYNSNRLSIVPNRTTYYVRYSNGWGLSSSSNNVFFYIPTEATVTTGTPGHTYSVEGTDMEVAAVKDATIELASVLYDTPTDTNEKTDITASSGLTPTYEIVTTKGNAAVISSITDGVATLSGITGTAVVKVTYATTDGTLTAWDEFIVTATAPDHFGIQLHKAELTEVTVTADAFGNGVYYTFNSVTNTYEVASAYAEGTTYYTAFAEATGVTSANFASGVYYTYDSTSKTYKVADTFAEGTTYYTYAVKPGAEITTPLALKGIEAGDTYTVWAVVKAYADADDATGTDIGTLGNALSWSVSDESIATIDEETGLITFTGNDGTVKITVAYEGSDGEVIQDSITISVTNSLQTVPGDGTSDFPEYPNEGAVRHDKSAVAVGNFSETGIAKVELSMTGVPFTTGAELDVVLMLDQSTSMDDNRISATVAATKAFINSIVINEDGSFNSNRIYVGYFNGSSTYDITDSANIGGDLATIDSQTELDALFADIDDEFDGTPSSQGTQYAVALKKCYDRLASARTDGTGNEHQQFCVFMSDGVPTTYQYGENEMHGSASSTDEGYTDMKGMFTGTDYNTRSADYKYEYYSTQMKSEGVTVYTVGLGLEAKNNAWSSASATQCLNAASILLNDISGPAKETDLDTGSELSKKDSYFFSVEDANAATQMEAVFKNIAQKILAAATDITVADKIGANYTMVFDAPNAAVDEADGNNEYYIEVTDYALNPVYDTDGTTITDYTRGTGTSLLKLYFAYNESTGYYAATDSSDTAAATPTFNTVTLGEKGTLYYWTTVASQGDSGISVVGADGTTYYFVSTGTGTHNMTAGAFASGTKTTVILTHDDGSTTTSATCQNMIIATPYFVYNAATKMLVWTLEEISSNELTLTYFLYLNNSGGFSGTDQEIEPKTYETNQFAYVDYTNFQGTDCRLEFPEPKMTWNGAQVSYVFYLVNEDGQPVNRAGRVVPFSEAVYVTDVYTHAIVWNNLEQTVGLEAERLAHELVPDVYSLYDDDASYNIHVYEDEDEVNLNNHFVIGGDVTDEYNENWKNAKTTYVFNTKADAKKYNAVGTYVADNGNTTAYQSNQSYLCKNYDVTGTFTKEEKYDALYGTYYTYTVTSATYSGTEDQVAASTLKSTTGGTIIGDHVYYVDEYEKIYTIVSKSDGTEVEAGFDFANTTVAFAVVWKPQLEPDVVVIDYGLDVVIDVIKNDNMAAGVTGVMLTAPGVGKDGTYETAVGATSITSNDGIWTASVENLNSVRFSLNNMQMHEPAKFYYEAGVNYYKTGETAVSTTNMYSSVTVIPATTVYYEDEYITFTNSSYQDGTYGVWTNVGTTTSATQAQDRPGASKISEALDADYNYGYDKAYSAMSTYSLGSTAKVSVKSGISAMASFDFYGTGFDVISLTSNTTGLIIVNVYDTDNKLVKSYTVDTYYGMKAVEDEDGNITFETTVNDPNALYQVPVMKISGLDYGKYTAKIVANYGDMFDHNGTGSYDFYMDAIRIYDPAGDTIGNMDEDTLDAYEKDHELFPNYYELRNWVIDQETFDALTTDTIDGVVFIDGATADGAGATNSVADYTNYGPNNELYLAPGQAVSFDLNAGADDPYGYGVAAVQIAWKSVGGTAKVKIWDSSSGTTVDDVSAQTIATATDLYYDITDLDTKTVVIMNAGNKADETTGTAADAILSITNVKVTYKAPKNAEETKTALDAYITKLKELELQETDYTEETWSEYDEALKAAEGLAADADKYSILEAHTELKDAYEALVKAEENNEAETESVFTVNRENTGVALMSLRSTAVEESPEETVPETTVPEETAPETTEPEETEPEETKPQKPARPNKPTKPAKPDNQNQQSSNAKNIVETIKSVLEKLLSNWNR